MIKRVENKVEDLTNSKTIASNPILSDLKLMYLYNNNY